MPEKRERLAIMLEGVAATVDEVWERAEGLLAPEEEKQLEKLLTTAADRLEKATALLKPHA